MCHDIEIGIVLLENNAAEGLLISSARGNISVGNNRAGLGRALCLHFLKPRSHLL